MTIILHFHFLILKHYTGASNRAKRARSRPHLVSTQPVQFSLRQTIGAVTHSSPLTALQIAWHATLGSLFCLLLKQCLTFSVRTSFCFLKAQQTASQWGNGSYKWFPFLVKVKQEAYRVPWEICWLRWVQAQDRRRDILLLELQTGL